MQATNKLCALVPLWLHINYAKQSQFPKSQVSTKHYITRTYENWTISQIGKTNPIQTQFKANSNPIFKVMEHRFFEADIEAGPAEAL